MAKKLTYVQLLAELNALREANNALKLSLESALSENVMLKAKAQGEAKPAPVPGTVDYATKAEAMKAAKEIAMSSHRATRVDLIADGVYRVYTY